MMTRQIKLELPEDVLRSVQEALLDYLTYVPGELDAEYIPDGHLTAARRAIDKAIKDRGPDLAKMGSPSKTYS